MIGLHVLHNADCSEEEEEEEEGDYISSALAL